MEANYTTKIVFKLPNYEDGDMRISRSLLYMTIIPLVVLFLGAGISFGVLKYNQIKTRTYISGIDEKINITSNIFYQLGYGKGIHAFKNFVLRGDDKYGMIAQDSLEKTNSLIQHYLDLEIPSELEIQSLEVVMETVNNYLSKISIVKKMHNSKYSIAQIDDEVMIDDKPAIASIVKLRDRLKELKQNEIFHLEKVNNYSLMFFVLYFGISLIISFYISYKISTNISKSIEQLTGFAKNVTDRVEHNNEEDDLESSPSVSVSHEELQILADTMTKMQIRLQKSFRELVNFNNELEQFSFMSAHDLKTPLKNVLSCSEILKEFVEHNDYSGIVNFSDQIFLETEKMISYVEDLLSFTRIGAEPMNISSENINLVIDEIIMGLDLKGKSLVVVREGLPPNIWIDKVKFLRVFQNLFENSLKYSNKEIEIQVKVKDLENGKWLFSVRDNGWGIRKRDFDKIFLPFRRATNKASGTGIGLAVVKKIVEVHGGEIWVNSKENEYTEFNFTINKELSDFPKDVNYEKPNEYYAS